MKRSDDTSATERLVDALVAHRDRSVLVVTGAGISHASGIPTFRGNDADAIWKHSDIEMATFAFFRDDPVTQWRWYMERFATVARARPNPAHRALVGYERWQSAGEGEFLLVTQNIDTLHEAAGSERMIKVHGTSDRLRCVAADCALAEPHGSLPRADVDLDAFSVAPGPETLPRCPECGDLLRAHVLFFDEYYTQHSDYRFPEVQLAAHTADLVLFVGTSLSVGVTDLIVRAAIDRATPLLSIDPSPIETGVGRLVTHLTVAAEEVLPAAIERLPT